MDGAKAPAPGQPARNELVERLFELPAGVPYQAESGTSIYFRDPDGARIELLADPLGEMYGSTVL